MDSDTASQTTSPGAELRAARGRLDLDQRDVSRMTGIPRGRISMIENGKKVAILGREMFRLRKHLGIPLDVWEGYVDGEAP